MIGGDRYRFNEPKRFAINAKDWIFISDKLNCWVKILNEAHKITGVIGADKQGLGPDQFNQSEDAEARGSTLWILNTHNGRITGLVCRTCRRIDKSVG